MCIIFTAKIRNHLNGTNGKNGDCLVRTETQKERHIQREREEGREYQHVKLFI